MKFTLIDDLNSHRQQTIERLQSKWQDAIVKSMITVMIWFLFYRQNNQRLFWIIFGVAFLINCGISIWLKRLFPRIEINEIINFGITSDEILETNSSEERIRRGDQVYQTSDGKWHKVPEIAKESVTNE